MNPVSMWFSTISKILWFLFMDTHIYEMRWDTKSARHVQAAARSLATIMWHFWHARFWWEFFSIKAERWICKKIVWEIFSEIDIISIRYATLHSWGHALVRYIRLKLNIFQFPISITAKRLLCYWLVLSTYNVDFLKYFTFFNKLFNKSLLFIYTSKKNQFSPYV